MYIYIYIYIYTYTHIHIHIHHTCVRSSLSTPGPPKADEFRSRAAGAMEAPTITDSSSMHSEG